jgi:hypothetical protein
MNDEARIELDTKNMQHSVKKEFLNVKDPITSNNMDFGGKFPNRSRGGEGGYGGAAKYNGGGECTPAWGNRNFPRHYDRLCSKDPEIVGTRISAPMRLDIGNRRSVGQSMDLRTNGRNDYSRGNSIPGNQSTR